MRGFSFCTGYFEIEAGSTPRSDIIILSVLATVFPSLRSRGGYRVRAGSWPACPEDRGVGLSR